MLRRTTSRVFSTSPLLLVSASSSSSSLFAASGIQLRKEEARFDDGKTALTSAIGAVRAKKGTDEARNITINASQFERGSDAGHIDCLSMDTEILSDSGFIEYDEALRRWTAGTLVVAAYDMLTHEIHYQKPRELIHNPETQAGV